MRVRGQWVQVNAEEIQAALDVLEGEGRDGDRVREVVRMALGAATGRRGLPTSTGVQATGWVGDLLGQLEGGVGVRGAAAARRASAARCGPISRAASPGSAFLRRWGLGACLADDMGLGKTIQTLALIQRDWRRTASAGRRC